MSVPVPLALIQAALADAVDEPAAPVSGPLTLLLDGSSDSPGRNYAVPVRPEVPGAQDIARLVALMRAAGRMPRLEFVAPAPGLENALLAAGFDLSHRVGLMTLNRLIPRPAPEGYEVSTSPTAADLLGAAAVQNAAYEDPEPAATTASRLARNALRGGVMAVARESASGEVVGAGLATPQRRGLSELAAVGVRADHRRRGVASAMTSALTQAVLDLGHQPFLQAEAQEIPLYQGIGYEQVGEIVFAELATIDVRH
jgi:GNAT superfamily N-acetyltransferase